MITLAVMSSVPCQVKHIFLRSFPKRPICSFTFPKLYNEGGFSGLYCLGMIFKNLKVIVRKVIFQSLFCCNSLNVTDALRKEFKKKRSTALGFYLFFFLNISTYGYYCFYYLPTKELPLYVNLKLW